METSGDWPSLRKGSADELFPLTSGSFGGTMVGSDSPQKLYWQNTKCDKDGGRPPAFLIVTCNLKSLHCSGLPGTL